MASFSSPKPHQGNASNSNIPATESFAAHIHSIVDVSEIEKPTPYNSLIKTILFNHKDIDEPTVQFPYPLQSETLNCLLSVPHQTSVATCEPKQGRVIQIFGSFGDFGTGEDGLRASIYKWTQ